MASELDGDAIDELIHGGGLKLDTLGPRCIEVIDARGQAVTPNQITALSARIVRETGGLVALDDIVFVTE